MPTLVGGRGEREFLGRGAAIAMSQLRTRPAISVALTVFWDRLVLYKLVDQTLKFTPRVGDLNLGRGRRLVMATALRVAPISQDCSDSELVAAVRRGSDTAFEELYSRYSHRIGTFVLSKVGDHGRAEDITQEIFIAALRRMRETDREIAFKAWIYEIAKNACIDSFRRARRAQEVSLDAEEGLSSADRRRLTVVATPDAALDSKQALDDLRGAFGGLSESHHEILVLRELEGRSYRDIGERLGMSLPVVESTLFRARRRLAEEYHELASGRRCEFVGKMIDSGPHYSLGIRDRRRIARHLAHCQTCRAHARAAGFDESILSMPSVAARIAVLLPIPFLRARWGALERLGSRGERPPLLALRSVHTFARSSAQIVGASSGAGRGAATAAALVLAGVGSGIVSTTYSPSATSFHRTAHAAIYPASPAAATGTAATPAASRATETATRSGHARTTSRSKTRRAAVRRYRMGVAIRGTAKAAKPTVRSEPRRATGVAPDGPAKTSGTRHSGAGGATDANPTTTVTGGALTSATSGGGSPGSGSPLPSQPAPPITAPSAGTLASTVSSTLGAVVGALPQIPGITAGSSSAGSTVAGPVVGAVSGITAGVGRLVGGS